MKPRENQVQVSKRNKIALRLLRWALDLEAQVQGQAGSLCCVFRENTFAFTVVTFSKEYN